MSNVRDVRVVSVAAWLIAVARRAIQDYAGPRAPLRTDQVAALLAASGCHVEVFPFQSDTVAMTLPRCAGVHPVLVNQDAVRTDRFFALRHEAAHVLAGDLEGAVYLAHEGYCAHAERVADLFALADLVPGWWIAGVRRGRTPWREVRAEVAGAVAAYAESWPAERLQDRAMLRVRLFRDRGI